MVVATGDYGILIKRVEFHGENMNGKEFIKRFRVTPGSILG